MDLTISVLLLILLAPLFLAIALAIKLDSPGPAIFGHTRVGSRRRPVDAGAQWETTSFQLYKFRSMVADADSTRHVEHVRALVREQRDRAATNGTHFKLADDPRITRVGQLLRRTSLDELPQLFNVLRGEMSLVGPRPLPPYEVALHGRNERERLQTVPGISGLWQVSGRAELSYAEMIRLDIEYVRRQSLWLDVRILAETVPIIFTGRGAA
jgi:lipopolysaccharide/colanic/teichoic acid biosynthesis glycosyltransferase